MTNVRAKIFFGLSVGLTLVSLHAGYALYQTLFGVTAAVLMATVFEILRLASLYSISVFNGIKRFACALTYVVVAVICFGTAMMSYDSRVISSFEARKAEAHENAFDASQRIKLEMSKRTSARVLALETHIDEMEQGLAKNPASKYYKTRIEQDHRDIASARKAEEEFFSSMPSIRSDKVHAWISDGAARLGISDLTVPKVIETTVGIAAREVFGIDEVLLQKFIGYSLAGSVELSIILLAVLGMKSEDREHHFDPQEAKASAKWTEQDEVVQLPCSARLIEDERGDAPESGEQHAEDKQISIETKPKRKQIRKKPIPKKRDAGFENFF